jgi:hypothetical protein
MAQLQFSSFAAFVNDELQKLCLEKRTGTLSIVTANNWMAQFGLNEGKIVYLSAQNKQGLDGLEILALLENQGVKVSTSRFAEGRFAISRSPLPTTDHILGLITGNLTPMDTPDEPRTTRMTDQTKAIVEQELMEFIGPMAMIVCEEVWNAVNSLDTALDALSQELPDPSQVVRFRQNVLKRLA